MARAPIYPTLSGRRAEEIRSHSLAFACGVAGYCGFDWVADHIWEN
jgi:hypothetical protein